MATLQQWASYYRRCRHRSHKLRLKCWRGSVYGNLCQTHNRSCFNRCDR